MIGKKINLEENFNKAQKEAVTYLDGPLLIVAGAGSGKTKVLTTRIANIIKEKKTNPLILSYMVMERNHYVI